MSGRPVIDRLGPMLLLVWRGWPIGVAFVATPARFTTPSLSPAAALDVGRHAFAIFRRIEMVLLAALLVLGLVSSKWRVWHLAIIVPGVIAIAQRLWLNPALDLKGGAIPAGQTGLPRSNLHALYIAAETVKAAAPFAFGLVAARDACRQSGVEARRTSRRGALSRRVLTHDKARIGRGPESFDLALTLCANDQSKV